MSCLNRNFLDITVHTARCGDCNARNTSLLKRCPRCGHQQCLPCHEKRNGAHGMYLMSRFGIPVAQSNRGASNRTGFPSSKKVNPAADNVEGSLDQILSRPFRKRGPSEDGTAPVTKKRVVRSSKRGDDERRAAGDPGRQRPGTPEAPISIRSSSTSSDIFVPAPARSAVNQRPESVRWSPRSDNDQHSQYHPPAPSLLTPPPAARQRLHAAMAPHLELPFSGRIFGRDGSIFDDASRQDEREVSALQNGFMNSDAVVPSIEIYQDPPSLDPVSPNSDLADDHEAVERRHRDSSASTIVVGYTPTIPTHYHAASTPEPIPLASLSSLPSSRLGPSSSSTLFRNRRSPLVFPSTPPQYLLNGQDGEQRSSPGNEEIEDPAPSLSGLFLSSESTQLGSPALQSSPTQYVVARPWPSTAQQQRIRAQVQGNGKRRKASSEAEEEVVKRRPMRARLNRVVLEDEDEEEEEGNLAQSQVQPYPALRHREDVDEEEPNYNTAEMQVPEHNNTIHRATRLFSTAQLRPRERSFPAYNHRATRSGRFAPRQLEIKAPPTAMPTPRPPIIDPAAPTRGRARPVTYEAIEEELDKIPFDEAHYRQPRPPLPPFVGLDKLKASHRSSVITYREQYERERQQEIADFDAWKMGEERKWEEQRLAAYRHRRAAERTHAGPGHLPKSSQTGRRGMTERSADASSESGMVISKEGTAYSAVRDLPRPNRKPLVDPRMQIKKLLMTLPGQKWDWETYGKIHGALHVDDQLPPEQRKLSREEREEAEKVLLDMIPNTLPLEG